MAAFVGNGMLPVQCQTRWYLTVRQKVQPFAPRKEDRTGKNGFPFGYGPGSDSDGKFDSGSGESEDSSSEDEEEGEGEGAGRDGAAESGAGASSGASAAQANVSTTVSMASGAARPFGSAVVRQRWTKEMVRPYTCVV